MTENTPSDQETGERNADGQNVEVWIQERDNNCSQTADREE
ncbi:MAG: hypothetical protein ACXW19_05530 [Thermoanaerobaculia bacterium]